MPDLHVSPKPPATSPPTCTATRSNGGPDERTARRRPTGRASRASPAAASSSGPESPPRRSASASTLASCGDDETAKQVPTDTNASAYPPMPPMPGMTAPTTRHLTSFFTKEEAATVDAFVARLIPGDAAEPRSPRGRRPDLHRHEARPVRDSSRPRRTSTRPSPSRSRYSPGPQPGARKTIDVRRSRAAPLRLPERRDATGGLPRTGSPALDRFTRKEHGVRFVDLEPQRQDAVLEVLEAGEAGGFPAGEGLLQDGARGHLRRDVRRPGSTAATATTPAGSSSATPAHSAPTRPTSSATGRSTSASRASRDMPAMNPGVPQDHVILPLAGTRPEQDGMSRWRSSTRQVDVVTIGAGWTAGMLAAKLCPDGTDDGLARAGRGPLDLAAFRPRPRQPPLLRPLRADGRPATRDLDLAAEPALAGAPDAPVRHLQPGHGPRRRRRALVGAALALPRVRLPAPLAHRRAVRGEQDPGRLARVQDWGIDLPAISSATTTRSNGTSAPRASRETSTARSSRAATRSRRRAAAATRTRR